jgi:hypothetical protein
MSNNQETTKKEESRRVKLGENHINLPMQGISQDIAAMIIGSQMNQMMMNLQDSLNEHHPITVDWSTFKFTVKWDESLSSLYYSWSVEVDVQL